MRGFTRVRGLYVASLDATERRALAGVVSDTAELLGVRLAEPVVPRAAPGADPLAYLDWPSDDPQVPSDPAVARLLPPASRDDDALAAEFRRLTESDLRVRKIDNLRIVWSALRGPAGPLPVARPAAPRWAAALSDVRLVIAARLGIETDEDAERVHDLAVGEEDPAGSGADTDEVRAAMASLYTALTWLQDSLVALLLQDTPPSGRAH